MPFPVSAASATTYPGISAPSVPRAGGAMLTAEQLATKGTEPFRLVHTECVFLLFFSALFLLPCSAEPCRG